MFLRFVLTLLSVLWFHVSFVSATPLSRAFCIEKSYVAASYPFIRVMGGLDGGRGLTACGGGGGGGGVGRVVCGGRSFVFGGGGFVRGGNDDGGVVRDGGGNIRSGRGSDVPHGVVLFSCFLFDLYCGCFCHGVGCVTFCFSFES